MKEHKPNFKHGLKNTRFYRIWTGIQQRCTNPKRHNYKDYGGRGIRCEWGNFEEFRKDMYKPYLRHALRYGEENTSINRLNNDGNYCKQNCKWSTWVEQSFNKRAFGSKFYQALGRSLTLRQWSLDSGIRLKTLRDRLNSGWSIERTLFTPVKH